MNWQMKWRQWKQRALVFIETYAIPKNIEFALVLTVLIVVVAACMMQFGAMVSEYYADASCVIRDLPTGFGINEAGR